MKMTHMKITLRELVEGYIDHDEECGVWAFGGRLNIRPPYQREFIYKDAQRDAVIDTIVKDRPLNVMYWSKNLDGSFEMIDGQQRSISICQYYEGEFSFKGRYFDRLQNNEQKQFLDYDKINVYVCEGTDKEKLEWFETINIAGVALKKQELRNAVYHGPWVSASKKFFSKTNGFAHRLFGKDYMKGPANRQQYFEVAIRWHIDAIGIKQTIEDYMNEHAKDIDADELITYFKQVAEWTKKTFTKKRKELENVDWGFLYNRYHQNPYDSIDLENQIKVLMKNQNVQKKVGIYSYILSHDERDLNLRTFSDEQKREQYEKQDGYCASPYCQFPKKQFELEEMDGDHIKEWNQGGLTTDDNLRMVYRKCNSSRKRCVYQESK